MLLCLSLSPIFYNSTGQLMKHLLFFTIFLCAAYQSTAQTYYPIPMQNAWWYELSSGRGFSYHYTLTPSYDTIINGITYRAIIERAGRNDYVNRGYMGAMREDNRIVYFCPRDSSQEMVLYDFNVQLGDTVNGWYGAPDTCVAIEIDSVQDCHGNYRRKIYLSGGYVQAWIIEGVGASTGLLSPLQEIILDQGYHLLCLHENDSAAYSQLWYNCAMCNDTTIAIQRTAPASSPISFYPNPSNSRIFFEGINQQSDYDILIYNSLGQLILQKELAEDYSLPLSSLPKGVYILQVWQQGKLALSQKLIRQE